MEIGVITECPHCTKGYLAKVGFCGNGNRTATTSDYACEACIKEAGIVIDFEKESYSQVTAKSRSVICSVCKGKGKVWVGSPATSVEIHQSTTELSDDLNNKIDELINSESTLDTYQFDQLTERLDKLIKQQNRLIRQQRQLLDALGNKSSE